MAWRPPLRRCGLSALLLLATSAPARGVRLARRPEPDVEALASAERKLGGEDESGDSGCLGHVPSVHLFRKKFKQLLQEDEAANAPQARSEALRIVVGVFTMAGCKDAPYRDVVRDMWMKHPLVCPVSALSEKSNCSVFVTFVQGENASQAQNSSADSTAEADVTTLPIQENMNCGKSQAWFKQAAESYPQATHVAKMDLDAFLHVSRFVSILRSFQSSCSNVYGGRPWATLEPGTGRKCCWHEYCPPAHCGLPMGNDFLRYNSTDNSCFSWMQGGLYLMTRQLAAGVSEEGGWWESESRKCNAEDAVAGHAVQKYAAARGECVAALVFSNLEGWWHPEYFDQWSK